MHNFKLLLSLLTLLIFINNVYARKPKVDLIAEVQDKVNQAYKLGYVDAAPIEMDAIEKKIIEAKTAKDKNKKKILTKLIEQIGVDLKIVKARFEVNQLNNELVKLQEQNLQSKKQLSDLKGQL